MGGPFQPASTFLGQGLKVGLAHLKPFPSHRAAKNRGCEGDGLGLVVGEGEVSRRGAGGWGDKTRLPGWGKLRVVDEAKAGKED